MTLSANDLKIIKKLDDGTLYAQAAVVSSMFEYSYMQEAELTIAYDHKQRPIGYLPTGKYYTEGIRSYIAAMPGAPPISPTYTPGAQYVLENMRESYYDFDVVATHCISYQSETASAYVLPVASYLDTLSASRRKDMRRKLKQADIYQVKPGTLKDVSTAWTLWMKEIWSKRTNHPDAYYDDHLENTLNWLKIMRRSPRATLRIEKYLLNLKMVGVNCCVIHRYHNQVHCDDYLCWYNPELASGLGIISAVRNLTHPDMQGYRYNLGTPGDGYIIPGHEYKLDIIPQSLRLTQAVSYLESLPDLPALPYPPL